MSCSAAELTLDSNNGRKEKVKGFNVILKDTILFPEGGGQPDDHGSIQDLEVVRVLRQGAEAVHFVPSALEEGSEVRPQGGLDTDLGRQRSSIELDTASVKPGEMEALEDAVNNRIRAHVPVNVRLLAIDDPDVEKVRSRGLPDDHAGPIRIIDIEGVDANMCCGTHVSNLSHLQVIKILGTEKGKKNKTNLIFIAGHRVLKCAEKSYNTEKLLTSLLKTGPDEHVDAVDKLQKTIKRLQKSNLTILRDMAVLIAQNFKMQPERGNVFSLHNKDGDNEFMNIIANEIGFQDTIIFLTVGEEKGAGLFLLAAPENLITDVGPRVAELLQGKGAGKNGRFQGKANSLVKRAEVEALLQEHSRRRSAGEE
ncbi:Alanyl-tRNA editing protein Aarsd1 [Bagarius yarrelli]|uniref:Alanyl-tRNA editing protein Aarsd1 n=1 Tax=Bagarius yarrelli TaxID=175774 RepID=A0A556TIG9_BAGYA|nr:Alanyl-tRNA editing protein Aarsd1 [Bagarius yarrelli]